MENATFMVCAKNAQTTGKEIEMKLTGYKRREDDLYYRRLSWRF